MSNFMNNVEGSGLSVAVLAEPAMSAVRPRHPASMMSLFPGVVSARGVLGLLLVAADARVSALRPGVSKKSERAHE